MKFATIINTKHDSDDKYRRYKTDIQVRFLTFV